MKNAGFVPLVAGGLAAMLLASPVMADGPMSVLNNPEARAALDPGAGSATLGTWLQGAQVAAGRGVIRYGHAQCIGENSFYTVGGVSEVFAVTNVVSKYDADANMWSNMANFPAMQEGPSCVCLDNKIYCTAGGGTTGFHIYDVATNTWTNGATLPRPVWGAAMGAHAGRVYMVGGDNDFFFGGTSNQVNIYDVATNTWTGLGTPMVAAAVTPGFAQIGSFLYVAGGWGDLSPGQNVNVTQRYDMATNTWTTGPAFTPAKSDMPLSATRTTLYAIAGDNNGGGPFDPTSSVHRLDLSTWPAGAWAATDSVPSPIMAQKGGYCTRAFFPAAGEVWVTNGYTGAGVTRANQYLQAEACETSFILNPAALVVDAAGNGVLEPAEAAVSVAPSWENADAVAVTGLTGAASNFTGPAGGTYTLDDATADYGTVAAGGTNSCSSTGNCYAVTVTAATRPAIHWDSQFTETLTPSGVEYDWTLHVGASFTDVPTSNPFYRFIETLIHHSVTGGCGPTTYCPLSATSREQMAVFVLIAKEGAGYAPPACSPPNLFADVPETSPFCRYIEELANRQVVTGCGPNLYCPTADVTREQMAIFVLRTLDPALSPPACVAGTEMFNDVPSTSPFCRWIEELARRAVVTGCGGGAYCPTASVTREQMGVFISVTFGLTLYGP